MKTDHVFEEWGTDLPAVAADVDRLVHGQPAVIGGSLANDLGTVRSDIDVFTFGEFDERAEEGQGPVVGRDYHDLGAIAIDIYSVDMTRLAARNAPLSALVVSEPSDLEGLLWLTYGELVVLHAIHSGIPLCGLPELERVRDLARSDLLPLYLCLRALVSFRAYVNDVAAMRESYDPWPSLIAARHCAEAALDLRLAHRGVVNPNPKWRLPLALQATMHGALEIEPALLVSVMFPDAVSPAESQERCMRFAQDCLVAVGADPLIRSYPQYEAAEVDLQASMA